MSWAARRRFIILLIVGSVAGAFLFTLSFAIFYETPTCTDGKANQGEAGVDCGGPCQYLCQSQVQPPTVLYTKAIQNFGGRTDVIASVANKNTVAAALGVPYTVTLYGRGLTLIQRVTGSLDLPPGATVPVYVLGIESGKQTVEKAFLEIDPSVPQWFPLAKDPRIIPRISNISLGGTEEAPRVQALLANPSARALRDVEVIAIVHNATGAVIAASKTVITNIPPQGEASAIFTWNAKFQSPPTSIEVVPVISLP
ncbi:hypothetical protein HYV30_00220 [Candidatus Kaiserbacteria bacterium]|nr:hypothetical protein [Candidatus Kaiserbacteria bacterium]